MKRGCTEFSDVSFFDSVAKRLVCEVIEKTFLKVSQNSVERIYFEISFETSLYWASE
jgi:hypothetical protein